MSGPYRRTIARDLRILEAFGPEDAPSEVAYRLKIHVRLVYDAQERYRKWRWMYQDYKKFYAEQTTEQLGETLENQNLDEQKSTG